MLATSQATAWTTGYGSRVVMYRSPVTASKRDPLPPGLVLERTVDVESQLTSRPDEPRQRADTDLRVFQMMEDPEAVHEVEALGRERRKAQVGLHEIRAVTFAMGGNIDSRADVHTDDAGPCLAREVQPAAHAAPGVEHSKAWPRHRLWPLKVPVEDAPVDVQEL